MLHTPSMSDKDYYIMEDQRTPKLIQKWLETVGRDYLFGDFIVIRMRGVVSVPMCIEGLTWLETLTGVKEGRSGLSCQPVKMWGRRKSELKTVSQISKNRVRQLNIVSYYRNIENVFITPY